MNELLCCSSKEENTKDQVVQVISIIFHQLVFFIPLELNEEGHERNGEATGT